MAQGDVGGGQIDEQRQTQKDRKRREGWIDGWGLGSDGAERSGSFGQAAGVSVEMERD